VHPSEQAEAVLESLHQTQWNPPAAASADHVHRRTYVVALDQAG
jgi:hypothetical protein